MRNDAQLVGVVGFGVSLGDCVPTIRCGAVSVDAGGQMPLCDAPDHFVSDVVIQANGEHTRVIIRSGGATFSFVFTSAAFDRLAAEIMMGPKSSSMN